MGVMTIDSARLLVLLEEVGRARALTDHETDLVEEIVLLSIEPFRWNPRLDIGLQVAAKSCGGIARFARRHSITDRAAYSRLRRIRKRATRKVARMPEQG